VVWVRHGSFAWLVLPAVRRAKVPVVALNLSPKAAIDYAAFNKMGSRTEMTGEWLEAT
jgi:L-arabinose isomerase